SVRSSSLTCLAGLALHALAQVAHALALVRLGFADLADVGGHLPDCFLVDAPHRDAGRLRYLELDAVGRLHADGMAETERELDRAVALRGGAVADADNLELLGEALRHADDHVVDERTGQAVLRPVLTLVVRTLDHELAVVLADRDDTGD